MFNPRYFLCDLCASERVSEPVPDRAYLGVCLSVSGVSESVVCVGVCLSVLVCRVRSGHLGGLIKLLEQVPP